MEQGFHQFKLGKREKTMAVKTIADYRSQVREKNQIIQEQEETIEELQGTLADIQRLSSLEDDETDDDDTDDGETDDDE
jgi:hypothetical protein